MSEISLKKALIHPREVPLLACLRALLTGTGDLPPFPLRYKESRINEKLSPVATDVLLDWLRIAPLRWLARSGGGCPASWPAAQQVAKQNLWTRYPGNKLALVFDNSAWEIIRWLARLDHIPAMDGEIIAPPPPLLKKSTGQAFLSWRLVDALPNSGPWSQVRSLALKHWIPSHLLLGLGYPTNTVPEDPPNWSGWEENGFLVLLEGCQNWLRTRWQQELGQLASGMFDLENIMGQLETLCLRGIQWLAWAGPEIGRWDLAAPLYLALKSDQAAQLLEKLNQAKTSFFKDGLTRGQERTSRLQCLATLFEKLRVHHQNAAGRLYFDEDHAAAQCLLEAISLPGMKQDWNEWAVAACQQVQALQNP